MGWIAVFFALIGPSAPSQAASVPASFVLEGEDLGSGKMIPKQPQARYRAVIFMSANCPCSISHEPTLKKLSEEFSQRGIPFVGIHSNQDESLQHSRAHFQAAHLGFPILQDEGAKIANGFHALKTPHAFILNSENETVYQGGVDDSQISQNSSHHFLKDALLALAEGKEVPEKQTRTLGCMIKRE